jgi:hypothetical protein
MITFIVQLNTAAREQLLALVRTGRAAAAKLLHARLLLKADVGVGGRRWTDTELAEGLDTSASTVHRVRQAWVEQGMEAALSRQRPTGRQHRRLDGAQEAQLIAVACSPPQQDACAGPGSCWRTRWWTWPSSAPAVRRVSAPHSKNRAQTVAAATVGDSATGSGGVCLCQGGCAGSLHASRRSPSGRRCA